MPRIDQFISAATLALADFIPLGQGSNTRKTTLESLKTFFTGDLSSQMLENTKNIEQLTNPNLLINGDFKIAQRGLSFNVPSNINTYTFDRWVVRSGNSSITITQTQSPSANNKRITFGSNNAAYVRVVQSLELLKMGENYTLSVEGYAPNTCRVCLYTGYTKNGVFVETIGKAPSITGTGTFSRYTFTFNVEASMFDINTPIWVGVQFNPVNVTDLNNLNTAWLNYIKLESGSKATPFSPKTLEEELAMCKRYFYPIEYATHLRSVAYNSNTIYFWLPLQTALRVAPSLMLGTEGTGWQIVTEALSAQTGFSITVSGSAFKCGVLLQATKVAHGLTDATLKILTSNANSLDSELYS